MVTLVRKPRSIRAAKVQKYSKDGQQITISYLDYCANGDRFYTEINSTDEVAESNLSETIHVLTKY